MAFEATFDMQPFTSISALCLGVSFRDDLLDPGTADEIHLNVANPTAEFGFQSLGGFVTPPDSDPVADRELCLGESEDKTVFLPGQGVLLIESLGGSFTVAAIVLTITGVPPAPEQPPPDTPPVPPPPAPFPLPPLPPPPPQPSPSPSSPSEPPTSEPLPIPPAESPTAPGGAGPALPAPTPATATPTTAPQRTARRPGRVVIPFRSGFELPPGFRRRDACHGAVRVTLRVKGRALRSQTVRLNRRCRYSAQFQVARARLRGARTVTIVARFRGNELLGPTGRAYRVRVPDAPPAAGG